MNRHVSICKFVAGGALGDRQIRVTASDATPDRVGDVMVPQGIVTTNYDGANNIVLANHDLSKPIGNAKLIVSADRVEAVITFAPEGVSATADEYCGLAKAGVLKAVSIGFNPIEWEPAPGRGRKYTKWEILELTLVAIPANPNALVTAKSAAARRKEGRVLNAQNAARVEAVLAHFAAIGALHDKAKKAHNEFADALRQIAPHIDDALATLRAIQASNDGDADDAELGATVERLKRMREVRALEVKAFAFDDPYPQVPAAFKVVDPSRQVRTLICGRPRLARAILTF